MANVSTLRFGAQTDEVTSLLRHRLGVRVFRRVHWAAYALWPVAFAHALGNGTEVCVGASIGVSFFPDHGNTADMLLRQADQAMYEAKAQGRGRICVAALPETPTSDPMAPAPQAILCTN